MAKKKSKPSPKPGAPKPDAVESSTFEESFEKLERITGQLEEGEIGLNEALDQYEQGVKLLRHCFSMLESAERRIELLRGVDSDGNPITRPVDDSKRSLDETTRNHSQRQPVLEPEQPLWGVEDDEKTEVDEFGGFF